MSVHTTYELLPADTTERADEWSIAAGQGQLSDEADLIARMQNEGDTGAFGILYERHYSEVEHYLQRLGAGSDAADYAQDAFEKAFKKFSDFENTSGDGVRPWLYTIARNVYFTQRRREARISFAADIDGVAAQEQICKKSQRAPSAEDTALAIMNLSRVMAAVPNIFRRTLGDFYLRDLPVREIADITGMPVSTVRTQLKRGRDQARTSLEHDAN